MIKAGQTAFTECGLRFVGRQANDADLLLFCHDPATIQDSTRVAHLGLVHLEEIVQQAPMAAYLGSFHSALPDAIAPAAPIHISAKRLYRGSLPKDRKSNGTVESI